jgi:hypothetical protein
VAESPVKARFRITESGAAIVIAALLASGALVMLAIPRPVAPTETPGLVLDESRAAAARAEDRALAENPPIGLAAEQVLDAYYRKGLAQRFGSTRDSHQQDRLAIARAVALLSQEDEDALTLLRASVVERLDDALAGRMDEDERDGLLGTFDETLETYGLIEDGEWRAPPIVVRALFKARFNAALHLDLTDGLHPIEVEAYWGWLALEADGAPIDRRLEALAAYEEARGAPYPEARGVLLFAAGSFMEAAEAFETAYAETGNVRLRNHALAAVAEAGI